MSATPFDAAVDRPVFLVETYAPGHDAAHFRQRTADLAGDIAGDIEILHAAYVPADDTAYWLIRADNRRQAARAWSAAGCSCDRVLAAVLLDRADSAFHTRSDR